MLIYLFSFVYCIFFHYVAYRMKNKVAKYVLVFVPLIWLAFLAGVRDYGVGTDTMVYSKAYFDDARHAHGIDDLLNNENKTISNKGYLFLNYFGTLLMSHIFIEWFLTELLFLVCAYLAVIRLTKYFQINLALFSVLFLFAFYNPSLNLMRQMCAISVCLLSFSFMIENKRVIAIMLLLAAITFHTSSAVFILAFAYWFLSDTKHKVLLYSSVCGGMLLGIAFFFWLLKILGSLGVFSKVYMERYGIGSQFEGERVPFAFMGVAAVILIGVLISYSKKVLTDSENFFLLLIHTTFMILMSLNFLVGTLIRISYYFYALDLVIMAFLLTSRKIHIAYKMLLPMTIIFMWLYNFMYLNGNSTYPYRSQILGIY